MARFGAIRGHEQDMMVRRREHRRGNRGRSRIGSLGLVLAVFALLCQSLVLLLPVPSMAMSMPGIGSGPTTTALPADAALFTGGYILCQTDDGPPPASDTDKAPCPHCVDCPVCQAFHAPTGLMPPTLPAVVAPTIEAVAYVATPTRSHALRLVARAHQPRAPPSIVRF